MFQIHQQVWVEGEVAHVVGICLDGTIVVEFEDGECKDLWAGEIDSGGQLPLPLA